MASEPLNATSTDRKVPAVHGSAGDPGTGVFGETAGGGVGVQGFAATVGQGVRGDSVGGRGVNGVSQTSFGVSGQSTSGIGVSGESATNLGVLGTCKGGNPGVAGVSDTGFGVSGQSKTLHGVHGESISGRGVQGISDTFIGVSGTCDKSGGVGVSGDSKSGIGVFGRGGQFAGLFEGNVQVKGNIDVTGDVRLTNADCAEDFDIAEAAAVEPGTVMVLNDAGELTASAHAYDKRVAGVISGAGEYKPGIVLDRRDTGTLRQPIGLLGKVFCKVDAQFSAIEVGDVLTSSPTLGHAMATHDPIRSFGAVIGKALRPLAEGQGVIPILIALQ